MDAAVMGRSRPPRFIWALVATQLTLVAAYSYGVVGFLTTDAAYFPEQAPPSWSWPAVIVVGVGYIPAALCLVVAGLTAIAFPDLRTDRRRWPWLVGASLAGAVMLVVMATPPGWELFDWYVG